MVSCDNGFVFLNG
jgi:hypothetical protein